MQVGQSAYHTLLKADFYAAVSMWHGCIYERKSYTWSENLILSGCSIGMGLCIGNGVTYKDLTSQVNLHNDYL